MLKRQLTKDINEISDGEKETPKPKRTPKKAGLDLTNLFIRISNISSSSKTCDNTKSTII
jgi:hypothetical protein